jgi:hypothetical protein
MLSNQGRSRNPFYSGKLVLGALLFIFLFCFKFSLTAGETIYSESQLTLDKLQQMFGDAGLKSEIDPDGDLETIIEGFRMYILVNVEEKSKITFIKQYKLKESSSFLERLNLCNTINNEISIIRASIIGSNQTRLYLDYALPTEKGLTQGQILNAARRFASNLSLLIKKDAADIIE